MTSSFRRSPCFTLTGNDVIDGIYYLSAAAKLASLLFGPLLLQWLFFGRAAGVVDYVVPLGRQLRKTIYVRKVKVDKDSQTASRRAGSGSDHQRRNEAGRQFARFRQLVKNIPSEQIVDVSVFSSAESHWDPYAMHRGGCLELYYCNMVEWCWWDSSLICKTNWFPSVL